MSLPGFGTWWMAAAAAGLVTILGTTAASAQELAVCAGLENWRDRLDVAIVPSRYAAGEDDLYNEHVEAVRQNIVTADPFSERRDEFRFHVFPLDDPLNDAGPADGTVASTRLGGFGGFPLADAVAVHRLLTAHGCPVDVVMVVIRDLPGATAAEGLGFTADMLARRGISTARIPAPGAVSARAILQAAFGPIAELDWFAIERQLVVNRLGIGMVVIGPDLAAAGNVAVHEFAHALASLEDEYEMGGPVAAGSVRLSPCLGDPVNPSPQRAGLPAVPCAGNLVERLDGEAAAPASFSWRVPAGVPLPSTDAGGAPLAGVDGTTVGAFRGGAYAGPGFRRVDGTGVATLGVFRSQLDCRMRAPTSSNVEFCAACRQTLLRELAERLGRLEVADDQVVTTPSPFVEVLAWVFGGLMILSGLLRFFSRRSRGLAG